MRRCWTGAAVSALAFGLAGCVHYAPAPIARERFPAALEARRLDAKPYGQTWSSADLLNAALVHNPQIAAAKGNYATALAAAHTAKLVPGVSLSLTGEYANEAPRWGYGAAADIPVDAGARRQTRVTTADLQALQAWYDYAEAVWSVRIALEKARVELDSVHDEIALAGRAVSLRRERLQRLERRIAVGEDDHALALTARTELATTERRYTDARGREAQAKVALAKALGVEPIALLDVNMASLGGEPPAEIPADWRADAAMSRSDVLRAIADYDIAENALRLEVAKQYPEVRLGPGYTYDHGVTKLPFSLSLALPTYDLNRRAIDQAEAGRTAAGRALEAVQASALAAVDTSASALAAAQDSVQRLSAVDLPAARDAAARTERAVAAGEADRTDELAAQAADTETQLSLIDARRTARLAAADLEDALRRSFDPADAAVLQVALTRAGDAK